MPSPWIRFDRPPQPPVGLCRSLRPIDAGLDAFPESRSRPRRSRPIARGQFVSPDAGPTPVTSLPTARPGRHPRGHRVATGGRLAPDKVFIDPDGPPAAPTRPDAACGCASSVSTPSMPAGRTRLRRHRRLRRSPPGPRYLLRTSWSRPRPRHAAPDGHHLRPSPRRGPDRPRAAAPRGSGRTSRSACGVGVEIIVVQHFDEALRRRPTTPSSGASAPGSLRGVPHDP